MKRPGAIPTVQIDNERVKVTEWRFRPAAKPAGIAIAWTMSSCP